MRNYQLSALFDNQELIVRVLVIFWLMAAEFADVIGAKK
jgi:hypothetical protein